MQGFTRSFRKTVTDYQPSFSKVRHFWGRHFRGFTVSGNLVSEDAVFGLPGFSDPRSRFTCKNQLEPFLDVQVSIDNEGYIKTDLFTKETAKCTYLLPNSSHPSRISKNIPYSLGYRLLRICSHKKNFIKRRWWLIKLFKESRIWLENQLKKKKKPKKDR